jgi:hypothetical protein
VLDRLDVAQPQPALTHHLWRPLVIDRRFTERHTRAVQPYATTLVGVVDLLLQRDRLTPQLGALPNLTPLLIPLMRAHPTA